MDVIWDKFESILKVKAETENFGSPVHNIREIYKVLRQFPFVTSKTERDN